jgi:hypothetical protein
MIGVCLCVCASWWSKDENDWLVRIFPCVVISLSWTYIHSYSHVFSMISIFVVSCIFVRVQSWRVRLLCLLSVVSFSDVGFYLVRAAIRLGGVCGPETSDPISGFVRWLGGAFSVFFCMFWCKTGLHGCGLSRVDGKPMV